MVFEQAAPLRDSSKRVNLEKEESGLWRARDAANDAPTSLIGKDGFRSTPMHYPRRIGYARVSTAEQLIDRQLLQLKDCCDEIRVEYISAVATQRPVFDSLISDLRRGDTFVVVDVDRAFRSAVDALATAQILRDRGVGFEVLNLPLDVQSDLGEVLYGCLALFAQLERKIIKRRTREGLDAARARGVHLGRPARLSDHTIRQAYDWMREARLPCRYVAWLLGVSRLTLQRGFKRLGLVYPISHDEREVQ